MLLKIEGLGDFTPSELVTDGLTSKKAEIFQVSLGSARHLREDTGHVWGRY